MRDNYSFTSEEKQQFDQDGYVLVRGLFNSDEVDELRNNFMAITEGEPIPGFFEPLSAEEAEGDILKMYPRIIHPHKFNHLAFQYMTHPKVMDVLEQLFEEEALASQSMFYFKPPGARGQALHQDNFYLKVEPGTCIAAWTAVDATDEENGGLVIVPGTNRSDIQCPHVADPMVSFTEHEVTVPAGMQVVPVNMAAGDVLFFNGSMIHGSFPNRSESRFRRAFIGHYVGISATRVGNYYRPVFTRNGLSPEVAENPDSGPCGKEFSALESVH